MEKEEDLGFMTQWIHHGNCMPQIAACLIKGLNPILCKIKEEEPAYDEKNKQPLTYTTMQDEDLQNITETLCEGSQKWWEYKDRNIFTHINTALKNNIPIKQALLNKIKDNYLNLIDSDKITFHQSYPYVVRALGLLSTTQKQKSKTTVTVKKIALKNIDDVGSPEWRKNTARNAALTRHSKPGGSRDKQKKIREIWASGKYTSRDRCAEEECAELNMSFSTARKALKNTPDPT